MKTQIISILDGVVFGKLRYKFLTIISAIVITTAIGMFSLHLGLPRKYIEILAFGLPIPIFIIVCITFDSIKGICLRIFAQNYCNFDENLRKYSRGKSKVHTQKPGFLKKLGF